ncbi:MAG TPA: DUF5069 domain-containing protein [Verrucomicrobiae bacterium]|nr:DUF5069 domain-containing protein [Verrucomicrobiae bacterium]
MEAPDLRAGPPRRWNETLGGVAWLPRLVDKARAALAGRLGGYLYGQSPMDRGLLRRLGLSHREFAVIVRDALDDDAVLRALLARDAQAFERARAWAQAELPDRHRLFLFLMDFDDGYLGEPWIAFKRASNAVTNAFCAAVKAVYPSNAAERAKAE